MSEQRTVLKTHAVIMPWPLGTGLHTWCGRHFDDELVSSDYMAFAPESVTCSICRKNMRDALRILEDWVPRLVEVKDANRSGDVRETQAPS